MLFLNITRNEAKIPEVIGGGVLGWFRLTDFSFENFHDKKTLMGKIIIRTVEPFDR